MARGAIALLSASLVLAGCATIPTSGNVVQGGAVGAERRPASVRFEANPPRAGDTEKRIVEGYLEAMASYESGYPTAREYLTPDAAASWKPAAVMTIYQGNPEAAAVRAGTVRVTVTVFATMTPAGGYVKEPAGVTRDYDFTLQQVEEEWRITNPPDGLLVSEPDFDSEFRRYDRYFFDREYELLVPDPVYLPVHGSETTLLTEALLTGPSGWLEPAVRTAFPSGSELALASVRVDGGTAIVELSPQTQSVSAAQRQRMGAQLSWTLRQVEGVQRVSVLSGGSPLVGESATPAADAFAEFEPAAVPRRADLYAVADTGVVAVRDDTLVPVAGPLGEWPGAREVAVDLAGARAAVVDSTGATVLWAAFDRTAEVAPLMSGAELVSLSWDRTGLVWAVDRGSARVLVQEPGGAVGTALGLPSGVVSDLVLSADGCRVAVVADGEVLIGVVGRDPNRREAVQVYGLRPVAIDGGPVRSLVWASRTELAVLVEGTDGGTQPYVVDVHGPLARPAGQVPGAEVLAAAPGQPLAVSTADGVLRRQTDTLDWAEIGNARSPTYPG